MLNGNCPGNESLTIALTDLRYFSISQVKQSIDRLEKYDLFAENKLKLFIRKEFDQCGSLLRKIMLEGEMYHLLTQLPLTVDGRNNLVVYSRSFLPVWYRAGVVCTECLPIFGTYSIGFISGSNVFHGLNTFWKLLKASKPFAFVSLSRNRYDTDI